MKTSIILSIVMVMLACSSYALVDSVYYSQTPSISIAMINQDPDPVEPGKIVEVAFKIDNTGTLAHNVVVELESQYPFSILPGDSATKSVGTIGIAQQENPSVTVKYKLRVANDATDDNHEIKLKYKSDESISWIEYQGLSLRVQSHDAILGVEKFSTAPAVTSPGEKTKLRIDLRNYASSLLKDVKVSLNLNNNGAESIPLSPIGSTNEKIIPFIDAQTTMPVEFELLVDASATSKSYKVPLNIGYSDLLNKNYSRSGLITFIVGDSPELGIALERTDVFSTGTAGNVVLRLVNKGTTDIKFLNVKIGQNDNVKVIGSDEVYIGKLDSDDFSTAEFKMYLTGKESVKIPVQVSYRDTNNNKYSSSKDIELKLYDSAEAKTMGLSKSQSSAWVIIIVVVVGLGIYFFRKRKSKK